MIMVISVTVVLAGSAADNDTKTKEPIIIGFKSTPGHADKAMVRGHGGDIKYSYTIINAIAAKLPEPAIENIQRNPRVTYVEMDVEVHTLEDTLPWGVDRIDAELVWSGAEDGCDVTPGRNAGAGAIVAIIDTGLDKDHPDLAANIAGGRNFVGGFRVDPDAWDDDNGHGTHCGGIVAAVDNEEGVIGVAPEASLYGVKVLDRRGSGYVTDIIVGIEWAVENGADIISMSLGTTLDVQSLHEACDAAWNIDNGVLLVAAAGNEGGSPVIYPAAYSSVIAVSATDSADNLASFSSTGPEVELAAPGLNIYSTYKKGGYATKSGTSMACPHVTGTAALVIASGVSGAAAVRQQLTSTAEDIGAADSWYGYGLVDADEAAPSTNEPPVADASGPYAGDEGSSIEFDGSGSSDPDGTIDSYDWNFGDGTTGTGSNPTHTYVDDGEYTVTLTVMDDEGGTGTNNADAIISNVAPTADAGGPYTGYVGQAVTFAGSATDPGTVDVLTYVWDFDYGGTFTVVESGVDLTNPSHTYDSEGSYTVALCVSDDDGVVSTISTATFTITAPDEETPVITDATGDIDGTTGEPVSVSATITDNVDVASATVHYTPIDGTETTVSMIEGAIDVWSADVPVVSDKVGTITYYITAQDAAAKTARDPTTGTYSITVTDDDAPVAEAGPDQSVLVNKEVTFDDYGSSDNICITSYSWDFDDSNGIQEDATGVMVTHIYTTAGTYTVTLTVSDDADNEASDTLTVAVTEAPANTMHVASIDMSTDSKTRGRNTFVWAVATVTIVNATGSSLEGATVSGQWSGLTSDSDAGATDANGNVALKSDRVKDASGTFKFTVTTVTKDGWSYNSSANVIPNNSTTA